MTHRIYHFIAILLLFCSTATASEISILPQPVKMQRTSGAPFALTNATVLELKDGGSFANELSILQNMMRQHLGQPLGYGTKGTRITLIRVSDWGQKNLPANAYKLDICAKGITLCAKTSEGAYYGIQTLRQIIETASPIDSNKGYQLPALSITDYPAREWRGLMLDVSRHFLSPEFLKQEIDLMSRYKLNRLHLHLTDDQGWRMEIKRYPELTCQSAWRTWNSQDSSCMEAAKKDPRRHIDQRFVINHEGKTLYGGYYTQDEMRDLVAYAAARHIDIVPEIDMPGHMMAAILVHPELSSTGEASWGQTFSQPLCPAKEEVYDFCFNILDEVLDIFSSEYIHIGADEVEKATWKESELCQQLMKREGLKDENALQSWFVHRIYKYLQQRGKRVITWDDAIEGDINKDVDIMYWRDWQASVPQKTLDRGHRIIFTPGNPLYFNRIDSAMNAIYHLKDYVDIEQSNSDRLLGVQANVWAEWIGNSAWCNHLIWPRLLAVAEVGWTPAASRDWQGFKSRTEYHRQWLKDVGIDVPKVAPALVPAVVTDKSRREIRITLDSEYANPTIVYTTDGTKPGKTAARYDGEIVVHEGEQQDICAAILLDGKLLEPCFTRPAAYHKAIGAPVSYVHRWNGSYPAQGEAALTDGIQGAADAYGDGNWQGFTSDIDVTLDLGETKQLSHFAMRFMEQPGPGVFFPGEVQVLYSVDGKTFSPVATIANTFSGNTDTKAAAGTEAAMLEGGSMTRTFEADAKGTARYVRIVASNSRHGFIFTDEIVLF